MTRLTDDELGELLSETFAGKENLIDRLPEATKRRSPGPALLAAAAVLAVLAGVLYGANRLANADPVAPAATSTATPTPASTPPSGSTGDGGDIWGAVVVAMARQFKPAGVNWQAIQVNGGHLGSRPVTITFSPEVRAQIEQAVRPVAPVIWGGPESPVSCTPGPVPIITVYPIFHYPDHSEVRAVFVRGCGNRHDETYRLERVGGVWKVTQR
ncbi:hypothetical protein OG809_14255 [Kribbella soli]